MNGFEKYYEDLEARKLVEIIESKNSYKEEVIEFCKKKLFKLNISNDDLKEYSKDFLRKRFYNYFTESKHWYNEEIDLESFFLNIKEVKNCFRESKSEYIENRKDATRSLPSG